MGDLSGFPIRGKAEHPEIRSMQERLARGNELVEAMKEKLNALSLDYEITVRLSRADKIRMTEIINS